MKEESIPHTEINLERKTRVVIGKIHLSNWIKDGLEERLIELFKSGKVHHQDKGKGRNKFTWAFGDLLIEEIEGEKVIFARLGKIKKGLEETVYDGDKKSFKQVMRNQERAVSYSNFIIHPKSHSILFEEKKPYISIKQFKENFSAIYKLLWNDLSDVRIDLIVETEEVFSLLKQFDRVTEVSFRVTPSNPTDKEEFRKLDELLKDGNTKEASFKFKNEEEGLKLENTIIEEGIYLSGAGYGEYTIRGEKGEEDKIIKSKDKIVRKIVLALDRPTEIVHEFWNQLKEYIRG